MLSGEAGIGKTILWETGVEEGRECLERVLTCRGVETEASLSFAGLSELIAPVFEEAAPRSSPCEGGALEIALLLAEPGDRPPDADAIGLAVLDVLRFLAERGPVVVAIDDDQWLDPASAGVLQIALRRLRDERIGLLVTLRRTPDIATPFELDRSFPDDRLTKISLGPLSLGAVHNLLEQRLGFDLTRPELARVQEATAGNPFFALELGRELVRTNTRPTPGQALHVPESLQELLGGRLARLPGETLDVLLEVATLAQPTVELVAAVQGDRKRVLEALEAAVHEGVVELEDSRLRFAHPLLASICYERAPPWKRRAVHRALAEAVSDVEEWAATSRSRRRPGRRRRILLWRPPPSMPQPEGRPPQRPSSTSSPPRPRSILPWRANEACARRTFTASRETQSGRSRCSSNLLEEVPPASSGDVLVALSGGQSRLFDAESSR